MACLVMVVLSLIFGNFDNVLAFTGDVELGNNFFIEMGVVDIGKELVVELQAVIGFLISVLIDRADAGFNNRSRFGGVGLFILGEMECNDSFFTPKCELISGSDSFSFLAIIKR
ncbi:hypothetical protein DAMA08_002930 [Martiniozyma asiatica (nom. inval.)]|nr:hypothetical protein DAMA08_002930 [Martiniozyma asiatica]